MVIFSFVNFFAVAIFDKKGMRLGILLGSVLTTIGQSLQCLLSESVVWAVIGHLLVGLAWPLLWNAPALVTTHYYNTSSEERALATVFSTSSLVFGLCLGYYLPESSHYRLSKLVDEADHEGVKQQVT